MAKKTTTPKYTHLLFFIPLSLIGGGINGLLGTGGGIVLTYMYGLAAGYGQLNESDRFASAMVTVLPISFISLFTYSSGYLTDTAYLARLIPASAAGGLSGAYLSTHLKPYILEKIFAILVIYSGIRMIL